MAELARVVGVPGAVLMGLGSIVGTGIFVSLGIAAGIAGPAVVIAVALGAVVASFNGLSSAQLAASHPVSGGTYEYGYRYLTPALGFTAGWMFLCAKSASAATAALGFAGYLVDGRAATTALAIALIAAVTAVVAGGLKRSSTLNAIIVGATLVALGAFVAVGAPDAVAHARVPDAIDLGELMRATALMFVAYTGYGRIATLGEEVRDPARTIPRAMIATLAATMALYVAVALVAVSAVDPAALAATAAPLEVAARALDVPAVRHVVAIGAVTAMAGVLLNLILGLSRVVLAMARRRDLPGALAHVDARQSPRRAVIVTGVAIAGLAAIGSVKTTWSFSAFSVLVYYAITNLAALRLPAEHRRFPRIIPALGLVSCLGLAWWVEPRIWITGVALIAAGLIVRWLRSPRADAPPGTPPTAAGRT